MEKKALDFNLKRFKLKPYKLHLFCRNLNTDYLVLLTEDQHIVVFAILGLQIEVCAEVTIVCRHPIEMLSGQDGEICLLTKECLLIWTIAELVQSKLTPLALNFNSLTTPQHALYIGNDEFLVSYPNNNLLFISKLGKSCLIKHPESMDMKNAKTSKHSFNSQKSFLVVPTISRQLPFIFSFNQLQLWKKADFFSSYISILKKYYEEDEILTDRISSFSISSDRMEVYVCTYKSVMQLNIKKMALSAEIESNYHVFSIKLITKYPRERCYELSSAFDEKTGNFTTLGLDRVVLFNLGLYKSSGRCIVQKKNHESIIHDLSYTLDGKLILICYGPKIFIWQQTWS